jgi:hypothetical protein
MKEHSVALPVLGLIAMTRVALGAGLGLLFASRMTREARRTTGWALLAFGAATTVPLAATVLRRKPSPRLPS